jgi:hypothetical protein
MAWLAQNCHKADSKRQLSDWHNNSSCDPARSIGNGEVDSSILSGSTIFYLQNPLFDRFRLVSGLCRLLLWRGSAILAGTNHESSDPATIGMIALSLAGRE